MKRIINLINNKLSWKYEIIEIDKNYIIIRNFHTIPKYFKISKCKILKRWYQIEKGFDIDTMKFEQNFEGYGEGYKELKEYLTYI